LVTARERHARDEHALQLWNSAAFVNQHRLREARLVARVRHVFEPAERIRVRERAMLAPVLDAVRSLRVMHAARVAEIGAGENAPFAVELQTESISTAFAKHFEVAIGGIEAPDG